MARMRSPGRIAAVALRPMLDAAEHVGVDVEQLFLQNGLDREVFGTPRWVPALLTDRLWTAATSRAGSDLPLRVAAGVERSSFGLLTYLVSCCETVEAAITMLPRYYALLSESTTFRLEIDARGACMTIDQHTERPPSVESFGVGVGLCFLHRLARAPISVREVRLTQERPSDEMVAAHERVFGARVRFGCSSAAWCLERSALVVPLRSADPHLCAILEEQAALKLAEPKVPSLAQRVRDQIALRGAQAGVRAADIAADLAMSERSLRRSLSAEGTSFRGELDKVLAALAAERLRSEAVDDVAAALGFSEPAAFRRAFRRWYGAAPRALVNPLRH
jgi:AraC-like DNA-binding protein